MPSLDIHIHRFRDGELKSYCDHVIHRIGEPDQFRHDCHWCDARKDGQTIKLKADGVRFYPSSEGED